MQSWREVSREMALILFQLLQDFLSCDEEKDGRGRERADPQEATAGSQGRNVGAWLRAGASQERRGQNGDTYHTYMYHTNPAPDMYQNDTTCMATARIYLMLWVICMETQVPFNNTRSLLRASVLKYCSRIQCQVGIPS